MAITDGLESCDTVGVGKVFLPYPPEPPITYSASWRYALTDDEVDRIARRLLYIMKEELRGEGTAAKESKRK